MNLRCKINGKEYDIMQGNTFAEEYNETLDSGSIIISGVSQINDIFPYDDVFIYTGEFKGYPFSETNPKPSFYKHLLVDQFTEEIINLDKNIYKYKIELMSETKGLEVVQLPNRSITQPLLFDEKKSIWEYAKQYVEQYSPKIKIKKDDYTWEYKSKYTLDTNLENIFADIYSPDFTLNNPSLREMLSKLFIVKDCIPYVQDDVIYALDISKRNGQFNNDPRYVNLITGSLTSDNYCNNLRREYSNALAQNQSGRLTEFLGFRNSNNALMTLENMRLEFGNEIYKISKFYMCYYKKVTLKNPLLFKKDFTFLCKQDITKLIKLNTERDLLSQDWDTFSYQTPPASIDDLAKYKICTLGYDIGSQTITDWGKTFAVPALWAIGLPDRKYSYIETIFTVIDGLYPFGVYDSKGFLNLLPDEFKGYTTIVEDSCKPINVASNDSLFYKTLFFEVDYTPFYSGCSVISRPDDRDFVVINDNASESLSLLEKDGLFQQEKIKRYGNKGLQINARYTDISQLQELGSVYNDNTITDIVIYHREYSIYDNVINCKYYGTKNYVLRNYYTSVFAKYRTWSLMDYGESVKRAENEKQLLVLSKDSYYNDESTNIEFNTDDSSLSKMELLCSAFLPSGLPITIDYFDNENSINFGCIGLPLRQTNNDIATREYFVADVNIFANGNSLCLNLKMKNNLSSGTYIKNFEPDISILMENVQKDYQGTLQSNYMNVDSLATGEVKEIEFVIGHLNYKDFYLDKISEYNKNDIENIYNNQLYVLPKIDKEKYKNNLTISFSNKANRYKDNKEFVNMTFQFEPLSTDENIVFSNLFMQLNDMGSYYHKFEEDYTIVHQLDYLCRFAITPVHLGPATYRWQITIKKDDFEKVAAQASKESGKSLDIKQESAATIKYRVWWNRSLKIYLTNIHDVVNDDTNSQKSFSTKIRGKDLYPIPLDLVWLFLEESDDTYKFQTKYELFMDGTRFKKVIPATANVLPETGTAEEVVKTYPKNMYVLTSENTINQQDVYKEISFFLWQENTQYYANTFIWHNSIKYKVLATFKSSTVFKEPTSVVLEIGDELSSGYEIVELKAYLDSGSLAVDDTLFYNNETAKVSEIDDSGERILYTITAKKSGEFDKAKNTTITALNGPLNKQTNFDIYDIYNNKYIVSQTTISDIFDVDSSVDEENKITIDLSTIPETAKSVQYWFANNNSIRLVFGVNITEQDRQNGFVQVYTSLLVKKDLRVFDDLHNVVGKSLNYLTPNVNYKTNVVQLYQKDGIDINDCFVYTLRADDTYILGDNSGEQGNAIQSGLREAFNDEIIIPETFNGKDIKGIGDKALQGLYITKMQVMNFVLSNNALKDCEELEELTVPYIRDSENGIYNVLGILFNTEQPNNKFYEVNQYCSATQIVKSYIPNSLKKVTLTRPSLHIGTFSSCISLTEVVLPKSITNIPQWCFEDCISLDHLVIPDTVTTIDEYALQNCKVLQYIVLPTSVKTISTQQINSNVLKIFYKGTTEAQWNAITKFDTDYFNSVPHYLYSENQPTSSGNFWHYDENNIPAIW